MLTRRQRILLDLLVECHRVRFHPSPAHLSGLLEERTGWEKGASPRAVRAELVRLLDGGNVQAIVVGTGSAANRYVVEGCPCADCGLRL